MFIGTQDQLDGLQYALSTLQEFECLVLLKRYREGKTLSEIEKEYGETKERVRMAEANAFRKLRQPSRLQYIKNGLYGEEKRLAEEKRRKAIKLAAGKPTKEVEILCRDPKLCIRIEKLNLSTRSYNGLKKAGINTIEDLIRFDMTSLQRIRNLGVRSCTEIIDKVHELGLKDNFDEREKEAG